MKKRTQQRIRTAREKSAFDKRDQELVGLREILLAKDQEIAEQAAGLLLRDQKAAEVGARVDALKADVTALKRELSDALRELATARGYLDRVLEDDAIRDGGRTREVVRARTDLESMRQGPRGVLRQPDEGAEAYTNGVERSRPWFER